MCTWCFFKIKFWHSRVNLKNGIVHKKCSHEINEQAKKMIGTIITPMVEKFVKDFIKKEVAK